MKRERRKLIELSQKLASEMEAEKENISKWEVLVSQQRWLLINIMLEILHEIEIP